MEFPSKSYALRLRKASRHLSGDNALKNMHMSSQIKPLEGESQCQSTSTIEDRSVETGLVVNCNAQITIRKYCAVTHENDICLIFLIQ